MATSPRATILVGHDELLVRSLAERFFLLGPFPPVAGAHAAEDVLGRPREAE